MTQIEKLKEFINRGAREYNDAEGFVTVETSTHRSNIDRIFEYISQMENKPINGYWVAYKCETCEEFHGKKFVHLSIEDDSFYLFENDDNNLILKTTRSK